MQDGFGSADRGAVRPRAIALIAVLALLSVSVPSAGQPINGSPNGTGTASPSAPADEGQAVSCQQVREKPQGDPAEPYRVVEGG